MPRHYASTLLMRIGCALEKPVSRSLRAYRGGCSAKHRVGVSVRGFLLALRKLRGGIKSQVNGLCLSAARNRRSEDGSVQFSSG